MRRICIPTIRRAGSSGGRTSTRRTRRGYFGREGKIRKTKNRMLGRPGTDKGLTSPELIAELDRIGEQREGISKLIDEAWIDLEVDRREEEAIVQYWARFREPKSALAERIACAAA